MEGKLSFVLYFPLFFFSLFHRFASDSLFSSCCSDTNVDSFAVDESH